MRKYICISIIFVASMTLFSCSGVDFSHASETSSLESEQLSETTSSETTSSETTSSETVSFDSSNDILHQSEDEVLEKNKEQLMKNNCFLIVNGKDISFDHYVHLDEETRTFEIPLTAVMQELGVDVEWVDETIIKFSYKNDEYILDISEKTFGLFLPPGGKYCCRKVVDDDVIVDLGSAHGLVSHWIGAQIEIDYDAKTLKIDNGNSEDETSNDENSNNSEVSDTDMESNWKLVVNGVDITQEYYAEKMSDGICLPFVAVMETLGAEFTWETDRKAEMKYLDLLFALDVDECSFISKANGVELFGVMGGGLFVSVPMDKELLLDSARVRYFFKNAGITFERNYDEKIVAINGDPNHIPGNALTESVYFY